ncbi:hypothetical protein [Myxococcus sp. Y35]|uniref:hypothetical protein n=1 Tax=Pseudomyxococcus flavus TaxID=3115648 RepID=UPI003CF05534
MNEPETPSAGLQDVMLDPRMRWRIVRSARRIISTSAALYLVSLFFLVITVICIREALSQLLQNMEAIDFEIENHLRYHPDVVNDQPDDPGILSFTFDAAQVSPDKDAAVRARQLARRIEGAFAAMAKDMLATDDPGCDNPDGGLPKSVQQFDRELPDTTVPQQRQQWKATLRDQICNYRCAPYAKSVKHCPVEDTPPRPDEFMFGTPGCDLTIELRTQLFVPATLDNCRSDHECTAQCECSDATRSGDDGAECFSPRTHETAALSRPLDVVLQAFANQQCDFSDDESSLVAVYFTTPEGIIRQWSCTPAPGARTIHVAEFAAQASYVRRLFRRATVGDYETDIYLDSTGFGPIRTRCVRIEKPRARNPLLMGVLCFDFTVSLNRFLDPLIRSNIIAVDEARAIMPDAGEDITVAGYWTFDAPGTQLVTDHKKRVKVAANRPIWEAFEKDLQHTFDQLLAREDNASTVLRRVERSITQLASVANTSFPHDGRYLLPGGWSDDGRSRKLLIVRPAVATFRGAKAFGGAAIASFLLMFLTVWRGNRWTRRMSENELAIELLRKLGVGIMLLDEDGMVMAANDAAEDVVSLFLPQLNTWRLRINEGFRQKRLPSDPAVQVANIIEPDVVLAEEKKKVPYKEIWEQRLRGQPATFYARTKKRNGKSNWIKVTAAPVVFKRAGKKKHTTSLSIVEPVSETNVKLLQGLDKIVSPEGAQ